MFTEKERAFVSSQRLARLATVSPAGQPDADVVGFEFDGDDILIGSYRNLAGSRKYKNVAGGANGFRSSSTALPPSTRWTRLQ